MASFTLEPSAFHPTHRFVVSHDGTIFEAWAFERVLGLSSSFDSTAGGLEGDVVGGVAGLGCGFCCFGVCLCCFFCLGLLLVVVVEGLFESLGLFSYACAGGGDVLAYCLGPAFLLRR